MNPELQALQDADFGWVRSLDSVWSDEETDAGPNQSRGRHDGLKVNRVKRFATYERIILRRIELSPT